MTRSGLSPEGADPPREPYHLDVEDLPPRTFRVLSLSGHEAWNELGALDVVAAAPSSGSST